MNKLPIYKAIVGDDVETGMLTISLVDAPAVEVDFLYFNEDKKPLSFAIEDEEQRKVLGVVMTADSPIYRRDDSGYEYYIVYDRQTIEKMAEKYIRQNRSNNVDLNHSFELEDGIYLNEFFIKDTAKGINPKGFEQVNDGSLFAIFHVVNDDVWTAIKEGTFKGFSLSGLFNTELVQFNKENKADNIFMTKLKKIKAVLRSLLVEMGEVSTDKGIILWDGDEDIKVGDAVKSMDEEGNETQVADGEYKTEEGKVIVVADGKVAEIKEPEEMPAEEPTEEEKPVEAEDEPTEPTNDSGESSDEKDARIKALEDEIASKDKEIEELKAKIAELENEPAAKPAEEEFAKAEVKEDNSPKGKMAKRGYKFSK